MHHLKKNIKKNLSDILKNTTADIENVFFVGTDIKHAIKTAYKHAAAGPDWVTTALVENGG